jgi:histidinol dehydrogenase
MDTLLVSEWKKLTKTERNILLKRTHRNIDALTKKVRPIMEDVKKNGDKAVLHYNKIFERLQ